MTAAVGLPTLRLIRVRVGPYSLDGLAPGQMRLYQGLPQELLLPQTPQPSGASVFSHAL